MTGLEDWRDSEPLKYWRALVEVTNVYEVWLPDHDGEGVRVLVERENDSGEAYELLGGNNSPVSGEMLVRSPDVYDGWGRDERVGPWPCCPFPGCAVPSPPYYGLATADWFCYRHSIRGCSRMHLPEKTEWP